MFDFFCGRLVHGKFILQLHKRLTRRLHSLNELRRSSLPEVPEAAAYSGHFPDACCGPGGYRRSSLASLARSKPTHLSAPPINTTRSTSILTNNFNQPTFVALLLPFTILQVVFALLHVTVVFFIAVC